MSMHQATFTSGGPLGFDSRVAEIFMAHIEVCCAPDERTSRAAARRRDQIFDGLDEKQQGYVSLVASAIGRFAS